MFFYFIEIEVCTEKKKLKCICCHVTGHQDVL